MGLLPTAFPSPLIYGPSFPKIRQLMVGSVQRFESRTNQNLFLTEDDFDERGTFPMARLLNTIGPCQQCQEGTAPEVHTCRLAVSEIVFENDYDLSTWKWWGSPDFWNCPAFDTLKGFCQSEAQKTFLEHFVRALTPPNLASVYDKVLVPSRGESRRRRIELRSTTGSAVSNACCAKSERASLRSSLRSGSTPSGTTGPPTMKRTYGRTRNVSIS